MTSVEKEAEAIRPAAPDSVHLAVSGIGRTNAAVATTRILLMHGPFAAVINAGIAGALPGSNLKIGDVVAASKSIYFEEGLTAPDGFQDASALGFPLGDFAGNAVPADDHLLQCAGRAGLAAAPIATVATCSGTDAAALEVVRRTGAAAEAMEGAAVLHAARSFGIAAIEIRAISNTTGDRPRQQWDIASALASLAEATRQLIEVVLINPEC